MPRAHFSCGGNKKLESSVKSFEVATHHPVTVGATGKLSSSLDSSVLDSESCTPKFIEKTPSVASVSLPPLRVADVVRSAPDVDGVRMVIGPLSTDLRHDEKRVLSGLQM